MGMISRLNGFSINPSASDVVAPSKFCHLFLQIRPARLPPTFCNEILLFLPFFSQIFNLPVQNLRLSAQIPSCLLVLSQVLLAQVSSRTNKKRQNQLRVQ